MVTKHIFAHVGVAAVGVGALLLFGVPTATAIPLALVIGCAVMMVTMVAMMAGGSEHGDTGRAGGMAASPRRAPVAGSEPHTAPTGTRWPPAAATPSNRPGRD